MGKWQVQSPFPSSASWMHVGKELIRLKNWNMQDCLAFVATITSFSVATAVIDADVLISESRQLSCNLTFILHIEIMTSLLYTSCFARKPSSPASGFKANQGRGVLNVNRMRILAPILFYWKQTVIFWYSCTSQISSIQSQGSISCIQGYALKCTLWIIASEKPKSYLGDASQICVLVPLLALVNLLRGDLACLMFLPSNLQCRGMQR